MLILYLAATLREVVYCLFLSLILSSGISVPVFDDREMRARHAASSFFDEELIEIHLSSPSQEHDFSNILSHITPGGKSCKGLPR